MFDINYVFGFIALYFIIFFGVSRFINDREPNKLDFIVANRNAGLFQSTVATVGGWVTGLGMFVSAQQFYTNGWAGFFWFSVPQIFSMLIFAWATIQINKRVPNGYTTTKWIFDTYGRGVGLIFQIVFLFSCLGVLATTFTAVFKYIKFIEIGNAELITGLIIVGTAIYSLRGGIRVSLLTSTIQTITNFVLIILLLYLAYQFMPDANYIHALYGKNQITNLFDSNLLMTFGISSTIVFLTGPMISAGHHQKSFAQQNLQPYKAWLWGTPLLHLLLTLFGMLGYLAYAWGGQITDPSVGQLFLFKAVGVFALAIFGVIILNCACMIIDAHGNAFGSIIAHDFVKDEKHSVTVARISILAIAIIAWIISICNFDLTYIFFTYSTMRVNLFVILILILTTNYLTKNGIFWTTLVMCPLTTFIGLYGMAHKEPMFNTAAMIIALAITPLIAVAVSRWDRK
jgi:Na+/proline symporter